MSPEPPTRPRRNTAWNRASAGRKRVLLGLLAVALVGVVLSIIMPSAYLVHLITPVATLVGLSLTLSGPRTLT